uniref:Period circadian-like C-terminal domain-containing protein n=1 Tax=Maylandia zebra TaxID=106582 RepID=A0A3P9AS92_9CICH
IFRELYRSSLKRKSESHSLPADPAPTPVRPAPSPAAEERRFVGLTKEVLSAHTQKEEQEYVDRFRHRILQSPYSSYLQLDNSSFAHSHHPVQVPFFPVMGKPGPEQSPRTQQLPGAAPTGLHPPDQLSYNFNIMQPTQSLPGMQQIQMETIQNVQNTQNFHNLQPIAPTQTFNPSFMAPVMAVILPNYPTFTPGYPSIYPQSAQFILPQIPITMTGYAPVSAPFPQPQFQAQPGPHSQTSPGLLLCSPRASSSVGEEEEAAGPTALFSSSRSSSPLQLNLLQEELPKPSEGQSSTGHNHAESLHEQHANEVSQSTTFYNRYGLSSSNSSKYFASNDSSDTSRKARKSLETLAEHKHTFENQSENSLWSMIQHTPERVMMTYQIHTRDQNKVLAEDREKLRVLQPLQPWFSQEQRVELAEVHPWIKQHAIPQEIDTQVSPRITHCEHFCFRFL